MIANLVAFVREVIRQRDLLSDALDRDDRAVQLMLQDQRNTRKRHPGKGHRRIWTRRDKRNFEDSSDGSVPSIRTERLLNRFYPRVGERGYLKLLDTAISELNLSHRRDLYGPVRQVGLAHGALLQHVAEIVDEVPVATSWEEVKQFHNDAVRRLGNAVEEINEQL